MNHQPDDWFSNLEDGEYNEWEEGEEEAFVEFESLVTPYLGYEVELEGTNPVRLRIVRPSTPLSEKVLVGVYPDCLVVQHREEYLVIPHSLVIVSVPREEWEEGEWEGEEPE